ncbi:c-type cytochrome [Stutzerimonas stutzeri]|uniref:c-type cytochrome n=1 Tax=Stutzerimonas stutzeri TaxID=316 RepID=UPI001CFD8D82|nr:cytochrome c [Stutzerimonas stutzeri]
MKTVLATLTLSTLLVAGVAAVVYSGIINVGADAPHSAPLLAVLETTRERAVAVRADDIKVPTLGSAEQIRSGAGNYAAMCVGCHLAPGVEPTELSQGLYPTPPALADSHDNDPAATFWVIKHGLKSTGMPAWGKFMEDRYIWSLVAFVEQLPSLTPLEYQTLVDASDGHQHGGGQSDMHDHSGQHPAPAADRQPAGEEHHQDAHDGQASTQSEAAAEADVHHHLDGGRHVH